MGRAQVVAGLGFQARGRYLAPGMQLPNRVPLDKSADAFGVQYLVERGENKGRGKERDLKSN